MATGDLSNNFHRLQSQLKSIKYPPLASITLQSLKQPECALGILHYLFLDYSPSVAQWISAELDVDLHGRTDARFVDAIYRILIDHFKYNPRLRKNQFLQTQFVERRILMVIDCINLVKEKHNFLQRTSNSSKGKLKTLNNIKLVQPFPDPELPVFKSHLNRSESEYEDNDEENVPLMSNRPYSVLLETTTKEEKFINNETSEDEEPQPIQFSDITSSRPLNVSMSSLDERRAALTEFQRSIQHPLYSEMNNNKEDEKVERLMQTEPEEIDTFSDIDNEDQTEEQEYEDGVVEIECDTDLFEKVEDITRRQAEMTLNELTIEDHGEKMDKRYREEETGEKAFDMLQIAVGQVKSLTEMMVSLMDRLDSVEAQLKQQRADYSA